MIIPPIPQWRKFDIHHIQTIIEILAKSSLFDGLLEIPVACRNDSDIHLDRLISP